MLSRFFQSSKIKLGLAIFALKCVIECSATTDNIYFITLTTAASLLVGDFVNSEWQRRRDEAEAYAILKKQLPVIPASELQHEKSILPLSQLTVPDEGSPFLKMHANHTMKLAPLTSQTWREFVAEANKITITFGYRKGFSKNGPYYVSHAILYLQDEKGRHGIFGYFKQRCMPWLQNCNGLANDMVVDDILRTYTLCRSIKIAGDKLAAMELLENCDKLSQDYFTAFTTNCFTPILKGLLQAKNFGFKVPDFYEESLLVAIPFEQNHGIGMTSNPMLREKAQGLVEKIISTQRLREAESSVSIKQKI